MIPQVDLFSFILWKNWRHQKYLFDKKVKEQAVSKYVPTHCTAVPNCQTWCKSAQAGNYYSKAQTQAKVSFLEDYLTLIGMRQGTFRPLSFFDHILSTELLSKIYKHFWR